MTNEMRKRFMFFSAVCNIVQIFGETELGSCEVDEDVVAEYTMSNHFVAHLFSCNTKEDIYEKVTEDILNGFPVWQFLKVSDWTRQRLENTYATEQTKQWEALCKKDRCYTCKYYENCDTSIGLIEKCNYKKENISNRRDFSYWKYRREVFSPKKSCVNYERK